MSGPDPPMRFPCWVQAIYSWGGETKKDLGFIEGDLIECLNAGDGSWWVGRLKRDRRMVGAFPSNFVKVLGEDFQPKPRKASPLPPGASVSHAHGRPMSAMAAPVKPRNSYLRKAFASYATAGSPNPQAAAREVEEKSKNGSPTPPGSFKKNSRPRPYSSMHKAREQASRALTADTFRTPSPPRIPQPVARASQQHHHRHSQDLGSRSGRTSPNPYARATSPRPPAHSSTDSYRSSSPQPYSASDSGYHTSQGSQNDYQDSPPPPPPPQHRVNYTRQQTPERHAPQHAQYSQGPSPAGSGHSGMTPSPLRDAMNDVMSSLDHMGTGPRHPSHERRGQEPVDPWSPEAFGEVYNTPSRRPRPHTAMELHHPNHYAQEYDDYAAEDAPYNPHAEDSQAQVQNYVQRMESRLRHMQVAEDTPDDDPREEQREYFSPDEIGSSPPPPPLKHASHMPRGRDPMQPPGRPQSMYMPRAPSPTTEPVTDFNRSASIRRSLNHRKSAIELGKDKLSRTWTKHSSTSTAVHSTSTTNSHGTTSTVHTLMSGQSAGGFSATSAGSLARRALGRRESTRSVRPNTAMELNRPGTSMSGYSYHDSHSSGFAPHNAVESSPASARVLGGLTEPNEVSPKKRGFFKKLGDKVKTGTATARSTVAGGSRPSSPTKSRMPDGISSIAGGFGSRSPTKDAARDMGLGGGSGSTSTVDWVQMRRDVNRSNSLSRNERNERLERAQMMDIAVISPVDDLRSMGQGNEAADGHPVEQSSDFQALTYTMVDKSARFVTNLPATLNAASLAQGYICRPHRSDLQKLRAIFTWVSERIAWEEDFEGDVDARRVIQTRHGSAKEVALLVAEMCNGVGIHAEMVRGYLKSPNESLLGEDLNDMAARPNHWWNAVLIEDEWRVIDCSLATPSNPKRAQFSSASNSVAESWWFLAKPQDICYTHVPLLPEQQHIVPPMPHGVLMALPLACPPFFKNKMQLWDFDTSLLYLDGLEMAHIQVAVPEDVECVAEVEARSYAQDADGDRFESGEIVVKRALAQADYVAPVGNPAGAFKRYTIKAVLPSLPNAAPQATLKVYAGKRGLMHGIHNNPHALAMSIHLAHEGPNPDYDFFLRHPTPHALRNELYVVGPQCYRLACNNTFVFGVRQHAAIPKNTGLAQSRPSSPNPLTRPTSALSIARPGSAMSMASASASGSAYSNPSNSSADSGSSGGSGSDKPHKPAKLAIQSPGGKILRMSRKMEHAGRDSSDDGWKSSGSSWETIIKIGEKGTWRGLVLADRTARWCVFAEWECV